MAYVEVEVNLSNFSTEELVEELKNRQYEELNDFSIPGVKTLVQRIYELKRDRKDYTYQLNALFYNVIGRI
jgi:hypothetical protein